MRSIQSLVMAGLARSVLQFQSLSFAVVLFGCYAALGFIDAALGVNWETLLSAYNLSHTQLAQALGIGTALALPLMYWGGRWYQRAVRLDQAVYAIQAVLALSALCVVLILSHISAQLFLFAVVLLMICTAMLDVLVSQTVLHLLQAEGQLGRIQLGLALGAWFGAVLGGLWSQPSQHIWLMMLLLAILVLLMIWLHMQRIVLQQSTAATIDQQRLQPKSAQASGIWVLGRISLSLVVCAVAIGFSEGAILSWGASFMQETFALTPQMSGWIHAGYYLGLALGASVYGYGQHRLGMLPMLLILALGASGAAAVFAFAPYPASAVGLWCLGVCLAGILPMLIERAHQAGQVSAYITVCAYVGMILEPWVVSWNAKLSTVMGILPLILLVVAVCMAIEYLHTLRSKMAIASQIKADYPDVMR